MAGSTVGEAWVAVGAQTDKVDDQVVEAFSEAGKKGAQAFDTAVDKETAKAESPGKSRFSGLGSTFAASFAGAFSAQGAFTMLKGFTDAAAESEKVARLTEQTIKSTGGAAGVTAKDIDKLTQSLSKKAGVDDEAIQSGENLLLQFKDIRNGVGEDNKIFDRTSALMVDMSVKMGTDAASAAKILGKALNEPGLGLSRLRAQGVEFTKEQEDQINAMNDAGDAAGAQKAILSALEQSYGGAAEAAATNADRQKVAWGNVQEAIGAKLLPVLEALTGFLVEIMIPALEAFFGFITQPEVLAALAAIAAVIIAALVPAFIAWATAAGAAAIATLTALAPLILIAAAVAALAAGVVYAYTHWGFFKNAVDAVAESVSWLWDHAIKPFAEWLANNFVAILETVGRVILASLTGGLSEAAIFIYQHWNDILEFFKTLPGKIADATVGMWDGIKDAFQSAINWIIDAWNRIEFKIPGFDPPGPGPTFPGFTLGLPNIPRLASGGSTSGFAVVGERGPELAFFGGSAAVFPADKFELQMQRALSRVLDGSSTSQTVVVNIESVSYGDAASVGEIVGQSVARVLAGTSVGVATRQGAGV